MPRRIKRRKPKLLKLPANRPGATISTSSGLTQEGLLDRREKAFNLRRDEGLSYREVGQRLGIDKDTAMRDCKIVSKMKFDGMIEKDQHKLGELEEECDHILHVWAPLLQPLIEGKLVIGDTKYDRKGQAYDITIPNYEAAKTATEMMIKAMDKLGKWHGLEAPWSDGKPSPESFENAGRAIFEFMRGLVAKPEPKAIKAEIIDNGKPHE